MLSLIGFVEKTLWHSLTFLNVFVIIACWKLVAEKKDMKYKIRVGKITGKKKRLACKHSLKIRCVFGIIIERCNHNLRDFKRTVLRFNRPVKMKIPVWESVDLTWFYMLSSMSCIPYNITLLTFFPLNTNNKII